MQSNLKPTQKLKAAELALHYRVGSSLLNPLVEPDWTRVPWYRRTMERWIYSRKFGQHAEAVELNAAISEVMKSYGDIQTWNSANGSEFESLVAMTFRRCGYEVIERGGSGDAGIDLEFSIHGYKIVVQCKAHAKRVSPSAVREFYGVVTASGAKVGLFVSKSGVSQNALEWAAGKPLAFLNLDDLIELKHPVFSPQSMK